MPTPVFPAPQTNHLLGWRGVGWGLTKKILFKTASQMAFTGRESVAQQWTRPKYEIALKWNFLRNDRSVAAGSTPTAPKEEYRRLHAFFEARKGRFEPFFLRYTEDGDFYTGADLEFAVVPAVGADPSNPDSRNYLVLRKYGGTYNPIGGVDSGTSTPVLKAGAVTLVFNTDYTVNDPKDGWVRLATAPAPGTILYITCHYYYRVAFKRDETEFETFARDFWRNKQVLLESRWW